jgi:ATP-dependent DNA helicase DinG
VRNPLFSLGIYVGYLRHLPAMSETTAYILLDFETTGLEAAACEIIEIGAIRVEGLREVARYHTLVKPKVAIPAIITEITGITNAEVESAPAIEEVAEAFAAFLGDFPIVAHNSKIEQDFLDTHVSPLIGGRIFTVHNSIDPMALLLPESHSHSMETLRNWAGVDLEDAHRADKDCLDLLKILQYSHAWMLRERPWMGAVVEHFLGNWWWAWFFREAYDSLETKPTLIELLERPFLGDLREFEKKDDERKTPEKIDVPKSEVSAILHGERKHTSEKFAFRDSQFQMSERIRVALENGERVAIEAPTGTGKSVAYLVPGVLAAEKTGSPLIVSTHSKALQDQLLEKDIPLVADLTGRAIRATTVKGQENYLCLRKLYQECSFLPSDDGAPDSPATEERYCAAFVVALAKVAGTTRARVAELDRVSTYLRIRFGAMSGFLERVKAHFTTTKGPPCPFYKSCHYFDSARIAHQSDVVIANHSLVFHWPEHLPKIRNIVFDEAHHLEDQLTDAYEIAMKEIDLADDIDRLLSVSRGRKITDGTRIRRLLDALTLPKGPHGETRLDEFLEPIRTRLRELSVLIPGALSRKGMRDSGGYEVDLDLSKLEKDPAFDGLKNLEASLRALSDYLEAAREGVTSGPLKTDPAADILQLHAYSMTAYADAVGAAIKDPSLSAVKKALDEKESTPEAPRDGTTPSATDVKLGEPSAADREKPAAPNFLRLLYWNPRENTWRIEVAPIEVKALANEFFAEVRAIALTSATLSSGANPTFITDRIGLALTKPFASLPSPYPLEKQAIAFFPSDVSQPGTPAHLDAIIGFTEQTAQILGGRTMLLMTANSRLRQAAEILRERLEKHGIQVFDSVSDRRAIDAFRGTERALLIGSERYGEGIDLPGRQLACVIIEKMNESMTRGPLAEARKSRTRFGLFDYDFPLRMIWLKQRVGRLIRSAEDRGAIVVFDPRFHGWSTPSKNIVVAALNPIPVRGGTRDEILMQIESMGI